MCPGPGARCRTRWHRSTAGHPARAYPCKRMQVQKGQRSLSISTTASRCAGRPRPPAGMRAPPCANKPLACTPSSQLLPYQPTGGPLDQPHSSVDCAREQTPSEHPPLGRCPSPQWPHTCPWPSHSSAASSPWASCEGGESPDRLLLLRNACFVRSCQLAEIHACTAAALCPSAARSSTAVAAAGLDTHRAFRSAP